MATPAIIKGTYLDIMIGDGESPEVFSVVCGLTTKAFTQQVNTESSFIKDCVDREDVPHRRLTASGKQATLTGSGYYNRSQFEVLQAAFGVTKNYRFVMSEPGDDPVFTGYFEGPFMLTTLPINGGDTGFAQQELTFESDGEWTFYPNS